MESKDWEDISLEATFPSTYIIVTSKPYDVKQYIILILQIHTFHMHCESQTPREVNDYFSSSFSTTRKIFNVINTSRTTSLDVWSKYTFWFLFEIINFAEKLSHEDGIAILPLVKLNWVTTTSWGRRWYFMPRFSKTLLSSKMRSDLLLFLSGKFWWFMVCCTHKLIFILSTFSISFTTNECFGLQCFGLLSMYLQNVLHI